MICFPEPFKWWREKDSNLRTLTRTDLQSAAIDHSATPPKELIVLNRLIHFKRQYKLVLGLNKTSRRIIK